MSRDRSLWLGCVLLLAACGDEEPLGIGSQLLPAEALRTVEVVLEPEQYLVGDTSFALYGAVENAGFSIIARDWGGSVNAVEFARFQLPVAIAVTDTLGVARTDSAFALVRGQVVLYLDTLASIGGDSTSRVGLHALTEPWDPAAVDWDSRSSGQPWAVPGGSIGSLLASAPVTGDSVVLEVDSLTMRQWADTSNAQRGARLSLLDGPARIRSANPQLRVFARSRYKPDTTFTVVSQAPNARFDYRPRLPTASSEPRFSGLPSWRTYLHFRPNLGELAVSCGPGCTVPLRSTGVTRAELMLQPRKPPPGFDPERALTPYAFDVVIAPEFPLQRSPLGAVIGATDPVPAERFSDGAAPVLLVITEYVRQAASVGTGSGTSTVGLSDWVVIAQSEVTTFGVGAFEALPRLRLVLTTAREVQLP